MPHPDTEETQALPDSNAMKAATDAYLDQFKDAGIRMEEGPADEAESKPAATPASGADDLSEDEYEAEVEQKSADQPDDAGETGDEEDDDADDADDEDADDDADESDADDSDDDTPRNEAPISRDRMRLELRAEDLGFDPDVIADMGDKALAALVERETQKSDGDPAGKDDATDKGDRKQPEPAAELDIEKELEALDKDAPDFDFGDDMTAIDEMDPDAGKALRSVLQKMNSHHGERTKRERELLKKINAHYSERDKQARSQIDQLHNNLHMTRFERSMSGLGSEYEPFVGNGSPFTNHPDSEVGKNLLKINEKAYAIAAANEVPLDVAWREAAEALFGKDARKKSEQSETSSKKKKDSDKLNKARRRRTLRPAQRETSVRTSDPDVSEDERLDRAAKGVSAWMSEKGWK